MAVMRLIQNDDTISFRNMFAGFSKFRNLFMTFLLYTLVILAGFILVIVPGIILLIALSPAFLLVIEDDLGPVAAIKAAWALTRGYKTKLFILGLVGLCLVIAGLLALGVGLLVAGPVAETAKIAAYREMRQAAKKSDGSLPTLSSPT